MILPVMPADDHIVGRRGLKAMLEAEAGFQALGETGDGPEKVRMVGYPRPGAPALDVMMPAPSRW